MFGKGISKESDILDLAVNINVIQKSGAWFAYNSTKIGQGRENAKNYLRENPMIAAEIEKKVREHYGMDPDSVVIPTVAQTSEGDSFEEEVFEEE